MQVRMIQLGQRRARVLYTGRDWSSFIDNGFTLARAFPPFVLVLWHWWSKADRDIDEVLERGGLGRQ